MKYLENDKVVKRLEFLCKNYN